MTTTGPLPVLRAGGVSSGHRMAVLEHMGALCSESVHYKYATADAVIDTCRGVLYIAVDLDPDPTDWASVCGLIAAVGWDNGSGGLHPDDPGEPGFNPLGQVCTWRLEYASQCIWCDGKGTRSGCPLCRMVGLGYPCYQRPSFPVNLSPGKLGRFRVPAPWRR